MNIGIIKENAFCGFLTGKSEFSSANARYIHVYLTMGNSLEDVKKENGAGKQDISVGFIETNLIRAGGYLRSQKVENLEDLIKSLPIQDKTFKEIMKEILSVVFIAGMEYENEERAKRDFEREKHKGEIGL